MSYGSADLRCLVSASDLSARRSSGLQAVRHLSYDGAWGALTTLSFSDNVDLQRSAALAFAEITEKEVRPVGRDTLDPILFLLSSHDTEVQRAASAALGNLAVNSMSLLPACMHEFISQCVSVTSGQQTSHRQTRWTGAPHPANAEPQRGSTM